MEYYQKQKKAPYGRYNNNNDNNSDMIVENPSSPPELSLHKLPKMSDLRESSSSAASTESFSEYSVGTVNFVDQFGSVSMESPENFTKSRETFHELKALQNNSSYGDLKQPLPLGAHILDLLKKHFVPIPDYTYAENMPSHQWNNEQALSEFITKLPILFEKVSTIVSLDRTLLRLKQPAYVLGDIHGNYKDLLHFESHIWRLGVKLCPANLVFLGDYVDRGPHSVETLAYLCALKLTSPTKVSLLRGNHESRIVNGDIETYGEGSFKYKCQVLAKSKEVGDRLWESANSVFDCLPISAIIDDKIFCTHGGVPRYLEPDFVEKMNNIPRPINDQHLDDDCYSEQPLVFDLLWSDPASQKQDHLMKKHSLNFAANPGRGDDIAIFSSSALNKFLEITGCTHLIRAHQVADHGVELEKAARVITVFSSSHYCKIFSKSPLGENAQHNLAAAVLISDAKIRVIVLRPIVVQNAEDSVLWQNDLAIRKH